MDRFYNEIGADKFPQWTVGDIKPDRYTLDHIVFSELFGLSNTEEKAIYEAIANLIKNRLSRAHTMLSHENERKMIFQSYFAKFFCDIFFERD